MADIQNASFLRLKDNMDIVVAVAVVVVVLMLIIPLPTVILDILLIINLALSLMIILSTMYVKKPSEFSSFPSLILLTTLFGLGLNVSSTRLILTMGPAFDGKIIRSFGEFVVRGNYVIGIIIFIILLAIQFFVITKGATRVSEVAARFTLDALPGKQLTINEDLNAGLITEEEARRRREEVRLEADFYGAMDGSSKFVSGNVKVALVITLIDIVAGLIIGIVVRGENITEAAQTYILLTIGDGLVSQIPSLLISTATGLIVTRTASRENFGKDIVKQVGLVPQVLFISGGTISVLGFLPGFPTLLNLLVGGLLLGIGYLMTYTLTIKEEKKKEDLTKTKQITEQTTTIEDIVKIDPLKIDIGYNLIPLVDKEQGGDLLDRIKMIRKMIALDLGILVPPIRINDNVSLDASEYVIKIRGSDVARGKIFINRLLAMNPKLDLNLIEGIEVKEPAFGIPAKWISSEERSKAEGIGFELYDPPAVIATHITEVIKKYAAELLTRQDVKSMIDAVQKDYPVIVEEVLKYSSIGEIQKVLQNLLKEGIKIRNLVVILETIADYSQQIKNIDLLTEYVRQALSKQIVSSYADSNNKIKAILVDPETEQILADSLHDTPQGFISTLDSEQLDKFIKSASEIIENVLKNDIQPVILSSQKIRRLVRELIERAYPTIGVLSYSEIPNNYSIEQVGIISII